MNGMYTCRAISDLVYEKWPTDYRGYGYVYFVSDGEFVKIGITSWKNLWSRIGEIQTSNPRELDLVAFMVCKTESKKRLELFESLNHFRFRDYKIRGEWYRINEDHIRRYKDINLTSDVLSTEQFSIACFDEYKSTFKRLKDG